MELRLRSIYINNQYVGQDYIVYNKYVSEYTHLRNNIQTIARDYTIILKDLADPHHTVKRIVEQSEYNNYSLFDVLELNTNNTDDESENEKYRVGLQTKISKTKKKILILIILLVISVTLAILAVVR
jgi:hypothetical protein